MLQQQVEVIQIKDETRFSKTRWLIRLQIAFNLESLYGAAAVQGAHIHTNLLTLFYPPFTHTQKLNKCPAITVGMSKCDDESTTCPPCLSTPIKMKEKKIVTVL